ncbi:MAG: antitoxin Xre/MbcA/ParS toxin-binding domain-containing protein [Thiohalocapsa sp.]
MATLRSTADAAPTSLRHPKADGPDDCSQRDRHGAFRSATVDTLARNAELSKAQVALAIGIPERALVRRKQEGRLHPQESSRLLLLTRIISRAEQVFEDADAAMDWLKSANAALEGATPLSLLDTDIGAPQELVTDLRLIRRSHNVS